ncbi:helix-turn-helix transcriptional regulator [uncultured Albimonas sp.]|uniref:helix-turn-helix domain-containing protein n=1 Tax=uncultured Albimonas sp. TaxID=1331701 RepID=UPI0030EF5C99|tara:strand:+ start:10346 stop:10792 length:447 start_codon:yes stop_codon:yes gene_type:complete
MTETPARPRIAATLRKARERSGLSLDEAARHLGISTASLSRMETAVSGVSADRVEALARLYQVRVEDLFEGQLTAMPGIVDQNRMHGSVRLVLETARALRVKPSPEKVADLVVEVYRREIARLQADPSADAEFSSDQHLGYVSASLKP